VVALCFVEGIKGKNIFQQEGTSTSGELGASSFGRDFGVPTSDPSQQICGISQSSCGQIWTSSTLKPFPVPPLLNPTFFPRIQFRFLSEVSTNPMPGIQFKVSRFES
jgi:hypothetical protein